MKRGVDTQNPPLCMPQVLSHNETGSRQCDSILDRRQLRSSCGSQTHSYSKAVFHNEIVFGGEKWDAIALLKVIQTCSSGLRSGDLAGQSNDQISLLPRQPPKSM
ncbi:hypothetical protein TNCV_4832571 [Trichonephila clavipes]|nr:hypothetical protein TNCV_4832571 [Trichonephila clavipes]